MIKFEVVDAEAGLHVLTVGNQHIMISEEERNKVAWVVRKTVPPRGISRSEWNTLDNLLAKHLGIGGYYDMVESMKMWIGEMSWTMLRDKDGNVIDVEESFKTLPDVFYIIQAMARMIGNYAQGFYERHRGQEEELDFWQAVWLYNHREDPSAEI